MDNIPSELLKNGGAATTTVLTAKSRKIWETKEWPKEWTQSLSYLYKERQPKAMSECLIGHPSEIMLRVILN